MKIIIDKPICFFDLESTGLDLVKDRVVSISILKVLPTGEKIQKTALVNPEQPIPAGATAVHGISDEMVKDKPKFKQIAKAIFDFLKDSDLAGYNSNYFDVPMLAEEFGRCDINDFPLPHARKIDVCNIFKIKESRTLSAAMKFYCNKDHQEAHSADADTQATFEVFCQQVERYEELTDKDVDFLSEFSDVKKSKVADLGGKIGIDENGDFFYTFGKANGVKVKDDLGFGRWMLQQDFFSRNTKAVVNKIITELTAPKQPVVKGTGLFDEDDIPF